MGFEPCIFRRRSLFFFLNHKQITRTSLLYIPYLHKGIPWPFSISTEMLFSTTEANNSQLVWHYFSFASSNCLLCHTQLIKSLVTMTFLSTAAVEVEVGIFLKLKVHSLHTTTLLGHPEDRSQYPWLLLRLRLHEQLWWQCILNQKDKIWKNQVWFILFLSPCTAP